MSKGVVQYNRGGKAIARYESIAAASKATGFDSNNILKNIENYALIFYLDRH